MAKFMKLIIRVSKWIGLSISALLILVAGFYATLKTGVNPSKTTLRYPMSMIVKYIKPWNDTEYRAVWSYLSSLSKEESW